MDETAVLLFYLERRSILNKYISSEEMISTASEKRHARSPPCRAGSGGELCSTGSESVPWGSVFSCARYLRSR